MKRLSNLVMYALTPILAVLMFVKCDGPTDPDAAPSKVTIIYPVDGATLVESGTIMVSAMDDDIKSVEFLIDGVKIGRVDEPPFNQFWDVAYWADGEMHEIVAKVVDETGDVGYSNKVNVLVQYSDSLLPEIIAPGHDSSMTVTDSVALIWHAVNNAAEYEIEYFQSSENIDNIITLIVPDTSLYLSGLQVGTYYWRVRALNNVGRGGIWSSLRRFWLVEQLTGSLLFNEYEYNPIISHTNDFWGSNYNLDPSVTFEDGLYKMWFTAKMQGKFQVRYGTSLDGIEWDVLDSAVFSPIISESIEETYIRWPAVIRTEGGYRLYYSAQNSIGVTQIFLATSADGLSWQRYSTMPVVGVGGGNDYDSGFVGEGHITYREGLYYLWYLGGPGPFEEKLVMMATSTDGLVWQKQGTINLALNPYEPAGDFRSVASVLILPDNTFEMFYNIRSGNQVFVGRGWSADGITWVRDFFNPIITTGENGTWNEHWSSHASVIRQDNLYKFWFDGYSGWGWAIGYGTATPYD